MFVFLTCARRKSRGLSSGSVHFLSRKNPSSTRGVDNWENVKSPFLAGNVTTILGLSSLNLHNDVPVAYTPKMRSHTELINHAMSAKLTLLPRLFSYFL
jgi:hypothetical protein